MSVATSYSGREALDLIAADKPDLILLDVMMPEMDGLEVCQRLQASSETVRTMYPKWHVKKTENAQG